MAALKNNKKWFFVIEAAVVAIVLVLAVLFIWAKNGEKTYKISIIVRDSDSRQWSAFKYGLKKAAEDCEVEMSVASTGESLTAEEIMQTVDSEMENGADALLIQPVGDFDQQMIKKIQKKAPVMLVDTTVERTGAPCTQPDHYAVGESLAKALLEDYNGNIKKKTFGIVQTNHSEAVKKRKQGFLDALDSSIQRHGAKISWSASLAQGMSLKDQGRVDFIIALDDRSLVAAGEDARGNNLHGALVYGIGNSTDAVYYLDTGIVQCLVAADGFYMGYAGLTQAARCLSRPFYEMRDTSVGHSVIRKEELFSKKNQELLFTMSQ